MNTRKHITMLKQSYRDGSPENLIFESRFESGNLMKAVRVTEKYYELHLRPGNNNNNSIYLTVGWLHTFNKNSNYQL